MSRVPFFTVIIPVFNKEKTIKRAIRSVLKQRFSDFELVVVCDLCTDGSRDVVKNIKDTRIKVLYRPESGAGGYAARNYGISYAKGRWITFLDADDEWTSDNLEKLRLCMEENPEVMLFSASRLSISGHGKLKRDRFSSYYHIVRAQRFGLEQYLYEAALGRRIIGTNSVCFRKCAEVERLFPAGKTERSGDLLAWVKLCLVFREGMFCPHVAAISYRDESVMNARSSPVPIGNELLNIQFVNEHAPILSVEELTAMRRYINRLNLSIFMQKKVLGRQRAAHWGLCRYFFWGGDIMFCFLWTCVSLMPTALVRWVVRIWRWCEKRQIPLPKRFVP